MYMHIRRFHEMDDTALVQTFKRTFPNYDLVDKSIVNKRRQMILTLATYAVKCKDPIPADLKQRISREEFANMDEMAIHNLAEFFNLSI